MHEYNNQAYHADPSSPSTQPLPYKRFKYDFGRQGGSKPVGSYNVGRAQRYDATPRTQERDATPRAQERDHQAATPRGQERDPRFAAADRSTPAPQVRTPRAAQERAPRPPLRTPQGAARKAPSPRSADSYLSKNGGSNAARLRALSSKSENRLDDADAWDYLKAEVPLSPSNMTRSSTQECSLNDFSGYGTSRSTQDMLDKSRQSDEVFIHNRSGLSSRDDLDRSQLSPASKDLSDPNRSGSDQNRSGSSGTADTGANKSTLSYREQWERNRGGKDPYRTEDPDQSVFSPKDPGNRSVLSQQDQADLSRLGNPDLNRSILSSMYPPNRSVLSQTNYATNGEQSASGSLRRDPVTHRKIPTHQQNGTAKLVRDDPLNQSRRSLSLSRLSLTRGYPRVTLYGHGYGVHNSLVNMALVSLLSVIMCILSMQLLFRVTSRTAPGLPMHDSVMRGNASYFNVSEVVVALSTISVMLNLCCLLTCTMQGYFAAKLIKCPQGDERAFRYLKECTPTRFISICGFFISVPVFLLGVMLYVLMECRSTPAIVATVILTVGISFCISMTVHSVYVWNGEKASADCNIPINNGNGKVLRTDQTLSQSELSTLV